MFQIDTNELSQKFLYFSKLYGWEEIFAKNQGIIDQPWCQNSLSDGIDLPHLEDDVEMEFDSKGEESVFLDDSGDEGFEEMDDNEKQQNYAVVDLTQNTTPPSKNKVKRNFGPNGQKNFNFNKEKIAITRHLFDSCNDLAFGGMLPCDMNISWSKRLISTAGQARLRLQNGVRLAEIELSDKVIDDYERLQSTLFHEMCHTAAWIIDGVRKPPHGPYFWKWANKVMKTIPDSDITTCHSFVIHHPFRFICTNPSCAKVYGRHTKKSIDIERHRCGKCHGELKFLGAYKSDGTPRKIRELSGFSAFVQKQYGSVKGEFPHLSHKEIMNTLSSMYKSEMQTHSEICE